MATAAIIVAPLIHLISRELKYIAFDRDGATAMGLNVRVYRYLFFSLSALATATLSSTLGVVYDYKEGNSQLLEMIEGEERFLGYVVVNPNDLEGSCAEMDRYYAHPQFVGAKYHGPYSNSYTSDPKTRALIDEVGKRGRPLLIHNAGSGWVTALKEAARANPNLPIIVAHGGQYPGTCEDAIELVSQTENVYLEFCTSAPERGIIRQAIDTVGPERILFGSDQDLIDPGFVLGSYADADLTPREERLIMYENAKRLFGL